MSDRTAKRFSFFAHHSVSLCTVATRCALLLALATILARPAQAGSSNSLMDISADGRWLVCSNRDNGTVTIVETATGKKVREIEVGKKPEGVTFLGRTANLAVCVYGDDKIVVLNAESGQPRGEIEVFDEPYGIVATEDGAKAYVTLEYPAQVVEIDIAGLKVERSIPVCAFPRGIALSERERRLYVVGYFTVEMCAVSLESGQVVDHWTPASSDNLARQVALHPTLHKAYIPSIRSRVNINRGEGSVVPFITVLTTTAGDDARRARLPMDSFHNVYVVANPWEVAVSPDGQTLCAVFSGTDDMFVCRVLSDDYEELRHRKTLQLGKNPRAVHFAPDGKSFYVYNALDFQVAVYDAESLRQTNMITVCENPLGEEVLLGKVLFYSAKQPMVGRRWISCSSCHPDGDGDGRTWQNPEGLRNTMPLFGMAWTHPIHWSADRDEVQDFEHTIRSRLMQGKGLLDGKPSESLEEPNKSRSKTLDALAAYSNSHKFEPSPHAKQGLSAGAQRGKEIFFSERAGCATCHSGPFYSDSTPERPFKLHDVGTGEEDPGEKMGPAYDTPTLLGIYRSAPYLHHGKATTLEEVLTKYNPADRHGKTSQLSESQIGDLVEFLKALPFEDPEPQAKAAGMTKIDR